jgi:hypothetical protein
MLEYDAAWKLRIAFHPERLLTHIEQHLTRELGKQPKDAQAIFGPQFRGTSAIWTATACLESPVVGMNSRTVSWVV